MSDGFYQVDPFAVFTPYGPATCIGVYPSDDCEWATFNERTQELWWFINQNIRRRISATNGRRGYSGFMALSPVHMMHIKRYVDNGWLPENYDPTNPSTWPL